MPRQRPLTTQEAARLLNLTPRLVRRYIDEGRLKAKTAPNGAHLIWVRDLQHFAAQPRRVGRPRRPVDLEA